MASRLSSATVGIFVNWAPEPIVALSQALRLGFAQLHGDETPQVVSVVARKIPAIKAVRLGAGKPSSCHCRSFAMLPRSFWTLRALTNLAALVGPPIGKLAQRAARSQRIILAGGLTPENVAEAILTVRPYAVDVASGVESRPGKRITANSGPFSMK